MTLPPLDDLVLLIDKIYNRTNNRLIKINIESTYKNIFIDKNNINSSSIIYPPYNIIKICNSDNRLIYKLDYKDYFILSSDFNKEDYFSYSLLNDLVLSYEEILYLINLKMALSNYKGSITTYVDIPLSLIQDIIKRIDNECK